MHFNCIVYIRLIMINNIVTNRNMNVRVILLRNSIAIFVLNVLLEKWLMSIFKTQQIYTWGDIEMFIHQDVIHSIFPTCCRCKVRYNNASMFLRHFILILRNFWKWNHQSNSRRPKKKPKYVGKLLHTKIQLDYRRKKWLYPYLSVKCN